MLWIHGAILLATNAFFCVMCSSRPARWTLDNWSHGGAKGQRAKHKVAPAKEPSAA